MVALPIVVRADYDACEPGRDEPYRMQDTDCLLSSRRISDDIGASHCQRTLSWCFCVRGTHHPLDVQRHVYVQGRRFPECGLYPPLQRNIRHIVRTMSEKFHNSTERRASDSTADSEICVIKAEREGGVAAWLTVVGSILVYYCSMGVLNSFGFFNNYYSNGFLSNTPTSTIAFIGTLQIALMNSLAAVSGALCDLYGVRVRNAAMSSVRRDIDLA